MYSTKEKLLFISSIWIFVELSKSSKLGLSNTMLYVVSGGGGGVMGGVVTGGIGVTGTAGNF